VPVLSALREIHRGYIEADRLMGSICITGPISLQMPVVERACAVIRGRPGRNTAVRLPVHEFSGWIFQDAGDLACAIRWTDRALDYALELRDQRVIAYTLMAQSNDRHGKRDPARGLGIANSALTYP